MSEIVDTQKIIQRIDGVEQHVTENFNRLDKRVTSLEEDRDKNFVQLSKFYGELNTMSSGQKKVALDIEKIKDDELSGIKKEITKMNIYHGQNKTDMDWIKKFFWIVATASIGGLIGTVFIAVRSMI